MASEHLNVGWNYKLHVAVFLEFFLRYLNFSQEILVIGEVCFSIHAMEAFGKAEAEVRTSHSLEIFLA